jgi:hypothetical protein
MSDRRTFQIELFFSALQEYFDKQRAHEAHRDKLRAEGVYEIGYHSTDTMIAANDARDKATERLLAILDAGPV